MLRKTKEVCVGNVVIGGNNPIAIQSMTTTDTKDVDKTLEQIVGLADAGCDIARCALYDKECAQIIRQIVDKSPIPVVGDVHFDYKIAVLGIENGVDKIRINPGNIGSEEKIKQVVDAAKAHKVPIRVGANAGSLQKDILKKHGGPNYLALVESALLNVAILEKNNFSDIVISIKSSDVKTCILAYREISKSVDYPLHLGVTEAGTYNSALIKSAAALGSLLVDNIGDTLRVSITGDPIKEIYAAHDILKYCGIKKEGAEIISCPTCARCSLDIEKIADGIEEYTKDYKEIIKIAVMGCAVNGPGEAREADIGIAGGKGEALLFSHGEIIRKIGEADILTELKYEVEKLRIERK